MAIGRRTENQIIASFDCFFDPGGIVQSVQLDMIAPVENSLAVPSDGKIVVSFGVRIVHSASMFALTASCIRRTDRNVCDCGLREAT